MNTASNEDAVIDRIFAVAHEGEDADIAKRKWHGRGTTRRIPFTVP